MYGCWVVKRLDGLCGVLILCFLAQPHPFILDFVLLRLGIYKSHFSFASWLPTRFCQKRAQKETREVPAASCFALCSCLHHPMVLPPHSGSCLLFSPYSVSFSVPDITVPAVRCLLVRGLVLALQEYPFNLLDSISKPHSFVAQA